MTIKRWLAATGRYLVCLVLVRHIESDFSRRNYDFECDMNAIYKLETFNYNNFLFWDPVRPDGVVSDWVEVGVRRRPTTKLSVAFVMLKQSKNFSPADATELDTRYCLKYHFMP